MPSAVLHQANPGQEGMRLGNFVARLQISTPILEGEQLPAAIRPDGLDGELGDAGQHPQVRADAEARRHVALEGLDVERAGAWRDATGFLAMIMVMTVTM